MKYIVVTGTKGKTTITNIIDYLLRNFHINTIRVDSNGSYINNIQDTTYEQSIKVYGKAPNVRPGRYIYGALKNGNLDKKNTVAILEAGIACMVWGTGVPKSGHDIGIFTNVYSDHIDYKKIISKEDILKRKSFSLLETKKGGYFIFNADDNLVRNLALRNKSRIVNFIPISKNKEMINELHKKGLKFDSFCEISDKEIIINYKNKLLKVK